MPADVLEFSPTESLFFSSDSSGLISGFCAMPETTTLRESVFNFAENSRVALATIASFIVNTYSVPEVASFGTSNVILATICDFSVITLLPS